MKDIFERNDEVIPWMVMKVVSISNSSLINLTADA